MTFSKWLNCDSNFTEMYSYGSNWQYACIGSGKGLAPSWRQAITWTNNDPFHWRIYAALGGDEKFQSRPSLLASHGQPSLQGVIASTIAKKSHYVVVMLITFSREPSLYANCHLKVAIMPTNIQFVIFEHIVRFLGLGFSHREMSRVIGVSQGAL